MAIKVPYNEIILKAKRIYNIKVLVNLLLLKNYKNKTRTIVTDIKVLAILDESNLDLKNGYKVKAMAVFNYITDYYFIFD